MLATAAAAAQLTAEAAVQKKVGQASFKDPELERCVLRALLASFKASGVVELHSKGSELNVVLLIV